MTAFSVAQKLSNVTAPDAEARLTPKEPFTDKLESVTEQT